MSNNPMHKPEWKKLQSLAQKMNETTLNDLFTEDKSRFNNFSYTINGLLADFSKQKINDDILKELCTLLKNSSFEEKRAAMFNGGILNNTEKRAVLHTALRRPKNDKVMMNDADIMPSIHAVLEKLEKFSGDLRNGKVLGASGKPIKNVISLGTGGSNLGPLLVCDALRTNEEPVNVLFAANIDGRDIETALKQCKAEETAFILISKSFTTQETMANANAAEHWLKDNLPAGADIWTHFYGVSTDANKAKEIGIKNEHFFQMWDWVNGRFSLWSAVGLPICLKYGFKTFQSLLGGAYAMDQHFQNAHLEQNIPVLLALIGIWNRNFLNHETLALLPYAQALENFPDYVQQLEMESNGKSVDYNGNPIKDYQTCPIIFGGVGTNAQHSFYQLLHQGTKTVPCDFIASKKTDSSHVEMHAQLLNNMLAQGQALMQGQYDTDEPHRYFEGDKPSTTLLLGKLDAHHLGMLLALYEHKTFVQGVIWHVNSFDQYGVELGKALSRKIEQNDLGNVDESTKALHSLIHKD